MYAIFEDGSHQYRVSEGDELNVDLREAAVGSNLEFDRVLLFSGTDGVRIGRPAVEGTKVVAEVLDHIKGKKVYIQKIRRRKNSHRRTGHRQQYTRVRVRQIVTA